MSFFGGGSSSSAAAAAPVASAIADLADFSRFPWVVRLRDLQVIGNIGMSGGVPYTYLALNLGKLYYYPAVLQQRYLPGWEDDLYEPHTALRTCRVHHITLAYLPAIPPHALNFVVGRLQQRVEEWVQLRWFPNARLTEFTTCLRRMLVLDEPLPPFARIPGSGHYSHLLFFSDDTLRALHQNRRLHGSWAWDVVAHCFVENPVNLWDAFALRNTNRQRHADNAEVVRMTSELPYMPYRLRSSGPRPEWLDFMPCFMYPDSPNLSTPSELHELCYWLLKAASGYDELQQFYRIFRGARDGVFKTQRLDDLHVTAIANAVGTYDTEFCCPRVDKALGR